MLAVLTKDGRACDLSTEGTGLCHGTSNTPDRVDRMDSFRDASDCHLLQGDKGGKGVKPEEEVEVPKSGAEESFKAYSNETCGGLLPSVCSWLGLNR